MPGSQKNKTKKRSNFATDSIKTLKMVHIKKKKKNTLITRRGYPRISVEKIASLTLLYMNVTSVLVKKIGDNHRKHIH